MMEVSNSEFYMKAKLVLFGIFAIVSLILFYYSLNIVVVSLIGIGIGVLVAPMLSFAKHTFKIPRALGALLCFIIIIIVISGASFGIWYLVSDQVESFIDRSPAISENLRSRLLSLFMEYPWLQAQLEKLNLGTTAHGLVTHFYKGILTSFTAISGLLFALILSMYTAVSLNYYFTSVVQAFPQNCRHKVAYVLSRCAQP
jgi:predicted PurR-regulated permease PerM